jgi:hypothetical protein
MPVTPAISARHWRRGTSTTHKSAAHTKYLPGATTAGSKRKNLLDQSREEIRRIRRSVETKTGKVNHSELVYDVAGTALAVQFKIYHTLRQSQCRRDHQAVAKVCHSRHCLYNSYCRPGPLDIMMSRCRLPPAHNLKVPMLFHHSLWLLQNLRRRLGLPRRP